MYGRGMTGLDDLMASAGGGASCARDEAGEGFYVALDHEGTWLVGFHLKRAGSQGQWEADRFAVSRLAEDQTLTGSTVRSLPIGYLLAQARALVAASTRAATRAPEGGEGAALVRPSMSRLSAFLRDARGGASRTDEDYAGLALEYVLRVEEGERAPAVTLARQYGSTPGTWTNRVVEARKRDLLTPAKRGESGGRLTPKAERLLGLGATSADRDGAAATGVARGKEGEVHG